MMIPVECCGKKRASRFCPDCGKKLDVPPLADLLTHCRQAVRKLRSEAEHHREIASEPRQKGRKDGFPEKCEARARRCDERADRWQSWVDALEPVVATLAPGAGDG